MAESTTTSRMAMSVMMAVIIMTKVGVVVDVAVTSTTDSGQGSQTVVDGEVRLHHGEVEGQQGGAVGQRNVEDLGVVRATDVEAAVAAAHRVLGTEVVGADLPTGEMVVIATHQTHIRDRSRRLAEQSCHVRVIQPLTTYLMSIFENCGVDRHGSIIIVIVIQW